MLFDTMLTTITFIAFGYMLRLHLFKVVYQVVCFGCLAYMYMSESIMSDIYALRLFLYLAMF